MKDRMKFAILLVVVVLVSVITTYITNLTLNTNEEYTGPDQSPNGSSKTKIYPSFEVRLVPQPFNSIVTVTSAISLEDLTIVYQYTALNGTEFTQEIYYGDYFPTWNPNHVIEPGETQFQFYRIPQSILTDCSTYREKRDADGDLIGYEWDISPKLTINVYGYS